MTPTSIDAEAAPFEAIDQALASDGPSAALDRLVAWHEERDDARGLLDALLLRARFELGLPPVQVGSLGEIPEPARSEYEDRYVAALRRVGRKLLDRGDLVAAWPFYRVLGEREEIVRAIDAYTPSNEPGDETLGQVIDVAFNQGVHPRRGFELILEHYGVCSAITAFGHLPMDEAVRVASAERLVRTLHDQLVANVRADIARRGQPMPPEGTPMLGLVEGRDWLFDDEGYHIDLSHLASVVRVSPMLTDPATIALAVGLTDYGRRLSERHRYEGEPPFEDTYADHGVYLRALLGQDVDAAVAHFRAKLPSVDESVPPEDRYFDPEPAQALVRLLVRLGRHGEAIDVVAEQLAGVPASSLGCPGVAQLCQMAGRPDRLAQLAREQGDPVHYLAARLQGCDRSNPEG